MIGFVLSVYAIFYALRGTLLLFRFPLKSGRFLFPSLGVLSVLLLDQTDDTAPMITPTVMINIVRAMNKFVGPFTWCFA